MSYLHFLYELLIKKWRSWPKGPGFQCKNKHLSRNNRLTRDPGYWLDHFGYKCYLF